MHDLHPHDESHEYRFCPRCGGALESRLLKASEPDRLAGRSSNVSVMASQSRSLRNSGADVYVWDATTSDAAASREPSP